MYPNDGIRGGGDDDGDGNGGDDDDGDGDDDDCPKTGPVGHPG